MHGIFVIRLKKMLDKNYRYVTSNTVVAILSKLPDLWAVNLLQDTSWFWLSTGNGKE